MHRPALLCLVWLSLLGGSSSMLGAVAQTLTPSPDAAGANARAPRKVDAVRPTPRPSAPAAAYWRDAWRGWHFYETQQSDVRIDGPIDTLINESIDEQIDEHLPPRSERTGDMPRDRAPAKAAATTARAPELVEFEQLQRHLEDFRHIAIMRPTEANVRRYMTLEASVVARASYFADVAQRVAWSTPELDPSVHGRPVNAKALDVFEQRQRDARSSAVAALGQDHVLFFFFRSDCPYCHAFAPTLRAFEERHGLQVVPVSLDGGALPAYPSVRNDNGIASALQVTQVPAVFLAQPSNATITPIGFGVLSESQLLERIATVSTPESHAMLPSATRRLALP